MSLKRKIAVAGVLLLISGVLLIGFLAAAYIYLPFYLESRIIPQAASEAGISDYAVDVRHVGLFGADLGALRIGPPDRPALLVRSVQVDYLPRGLYHQRIRQITLSGIEIAGEVKDGRFKLHGLDLEKLLAGAGRQAQAKSPPRDAGFAMNLAKLAVRNSRVVVEVNERVFKLPFEFDMLPRDTHYNIVDLTARLFPRGETVEFKLGLNRLQRWATLRLEPTTLDLDRFADVTAQISDLSISGVLKTHAAAKLGWNPLRIIAVDASVVLQGGRISGRGIHLQTSSNPAIESVPLRIRLPEKHHHVWRLEGGSLSMTAPVPLTLSQFDGTVQKNDAKLAASIDFSTTLLPSKLGGVNRFPLNLRDPILLQSRFTAEYHRTGQWSCDISNIPLNNERREALRLDGAPYAITAAHPEFNLSAESASGKIEADYSLRVPSLKISAGPEAIAVPVLVLKGDARLDGAILGTKFKLSAPKTGITLKDGQFNLPKFSISGRLDRTADRHLTSDGLLEFSGASGRSPRYPVRFEGARAKIPFKWPPVSKTAEGSIYVNKLKFKNMNFGSLHSVIRQTTSGFEFEGRHQSALLPRLNSRFSGKSTLFGKDPLTTGVRIEFSRSAAAPEIDLGQFSPQARGIRIKGKFQLVGDLMQGPQGFSGNIQADFHDGNLRWDQNKLSLAGIRLTLRMPELPKLRSAPGQQMYFNRLSLGEFTAQDGRIDFQIESDTSLLLEKIRFRWCGGSVETQSIRLSPGADDFYITFYCDRLNLARVLEQFGAAAAEGQGTVNGRIPLQYAGGKLRFDDGFLFSTPGEGGKIRLTGTDILTAGIPPDTAQYVQMELAKEALKDYDYSWAKLNLTSRGEELLLQMQMDGKPARTLPFVYRKDIGGFMKIEANAKGSKFQGIRLDVNFRLPLNKLLQYKELLEMIQ